MSEELGMVVVLRSSTGDRLDFATPDSGPMSLPDVLDRIREVIAKATNRDDGLWETIVIVRWSDMEKLKQPPPGATKSDEEPLAL